MTDEKNDPRLDVLEAAERICREVADDCERTGRTSGSSAAEECADQIAGFASSLKKIEVTGEAIDALIVWRDFAAIDYHGEDLVYHMRACLSQLQDADVPPQHRAALPVFKSLDAEAQLTRIATVLGVDLDADEGFDDLE